MTNLYALCRPTGTAEVKRVRISQPVQAKIEGLFQGQAAAFLDGIDEEIEFGGDWKPDSDEILVIDAPDEATLITAALAANPMALPDIDAANFLGEQIKALFVSVQNGAHSQVLIQGFSAQQILARRFSLLLDGNMFRELTDPAFSLDNYIVAILEGGKLKFKNFHNVRRIFELSQFYQEASDQEIDAFCAHDSLHVADVAAFKEIADQTIRKMVHAISKTNVLSIYTADDIVAKAASLGLAINAGDGKIVVPNDRKSVKQLFRFLDDGIYQAPLTAKKYVTNSKRPLA